MAFCTSLPIIVALFKNFGLEISEMCDYLGESRVVGGVIANN